MMVSEYWKSILAFLGLVATNAAASLMQYEVPWPLTGGDWARWLVSIVAGTWLVYRVPNTDHGSASR